MAVTFTQTPTTPNGTQSTIIFGLEGLTTASQAKYICDVKFSGGGNTLVRIKQPANNDGYGVFEISDILHDYLEYDQTWKITNLSNSTNNNVRDFTIEFGEEYGTSPSSSLTVDANQASDSITVYPAVTELTEGYNWDSGSYYTNFLTNAPTTQYIKTTEYATLSHINISGANPTGFTIEVYAENNALLASRFFGNGFNTSTTANKLLHLPVGPKNFDGDLSLGVLTTDAWSYYTVTRASGQVITYRRQEDCIAENGTRFAFINKLGVYDYYTATKTKTEQQAFTTDTYEQSFIDFSTSNGLVPFNPSRRGTTVYNKKIDASFTAQTDWLDTETADWLMELFQSPEVFIQDETDFIPVIITNAIADLKTNPRGQKLFTYKIEYKLANTKKARR
jgi:hypothetical protein